MDKKIVAFAGGGTAGHVFPAFPLISRLKELGWSVFWIGSIGGMEQHLVEQEGIPFYGVSSGKFRRYFSLRNFVDLFRIAWGFLQSLMLLRRIRPGFLFSKGGFVSVPPVAAARLLKIPACTHESDVDPGLATRLNLKLGARILVSWEKTLDFLSPAMKKRAIVTGNPVRDSLIHGSRAEGRRLAELKNDDRPLLLVLGGSQGAREINTMIFGILDKLLAFTAVVHQTGPVDGQIPARNGYWGLPFFNQELPHLLAAADIAVARAGAGTLWELAACRIPTIYIPLRTATRGDQIRNAEQAERMGFATVLDAAAAPEDLLGRIHSLFENKTQRDTMSRAAKTLDAMGAADRIIKIMEA